LWVSFHHPLSTGHLEPSAPEAPSREKATSGAPLDRMAHSTIRDPAPRNPTGKEALLSLAEERPMKNHWLSLWLSAANSAAGAARGFLTAEMRRQQKAMVNEAGRYTAKDRAATPKKRAASKRRKKAGRL
jgi:hypothetical protein